MDGEARHARREARRAGLRTGLILRAAGAVCLAACASVGEPPGGPPDTTPPAVLAFVPDSGAVLTAVPRDAWVVLDEVVAERVASPRPDISSAVLLSPVQGPVDVEWHRDRIRVRPHEGFKAGRIYHLELYPVLADLRQNKMKTGKLAIFSTGPDLPTAALAGAVADWGGGKPATDALVEAVLLPDSLAYRTVADSTGSFVLPGIPAGDYLVYGVLDADNNRERGPREAYDTVRVHLADTASVEVYAFTHDTTGPRIRQAEIVDSMTLRLTFDRPLDPARNLDSAAVRLALTADSTTPLGIHAVWTPQQADSVNRALAAQRAAADSVRLRLQADSARARQRADSARAPQARPGQPQAAPAARPTAPLPPLPTQPGPPAPPGARSGTAAQAPRDSSRAMKMLARRPAPAATRLVRLDAPLIPGSRYVGRVLGARSLSGNESVAPFQFAVPIPKPATRAGQPRTRADSARVAADSARLQPVRAPGDSTPPRPGAPAARDTTHAPSPRDTTRTPARDSTRTSPPPAALPGRTGRHP